MAIVNVEDARRLARRRLPRIFFDYIDGGAFAEKTRQANEADFGDILLKQSVLTGAHTPDLATHFLGRKFSLPFMLGPVGFLGLYASVNSFSRLTAAIKGRSEVLKTWPARAGDRVLL